MIETVITDLGLSHPTAFIWLTKNDVVPEVFVRGVGAIILAIPPIAVLYQFNVLPVAPDAVNMAGVAF